MVSRALPAFVSGVVAAVGGFCAPGVTATSAGKIDGRDSAARALDRYVQEAQRPPSASEAAISFHIGAELPKLHKHGVMRGFKVITAAGRIVYTQLHFVGDNLIRTAVIARVLSADTKSKTDI